MAQRNSLDLRRLFTNIGALLSASVITKIVSAGTTILLARQVGVAGFGEYAAAMALLRIASIAFSLGLDAWLLRNGFREGSDEKLARYTTINLFIKLNLGLLWLLIMSAVGYALLSTIYTPVLPITLALAIWFEEIANTVWSAFQASLRNQTTFLLTILFHGLILAGTLLLIVQDRENILAFAVTRMVAAALGCGLALWWLARTLGFSFIAEGTVQQTQRQLSETVPFGLSVGLSLIYGRADTAIAAHFLGSEAAGLYSSAMSLMSMALLMPLAIYLVMLPILSRAHAEHSPALLRMTKRMVGWNVVVGLVLGALLALVAEPLMQLIYGAQYAESGAVLTIFSGVLALRFVSFALAVFITAVGWQGKRTSIQA
ncbi:MAG: oligosaccharide flippase family protein, partial [Caldilineaceae bacterium]|nr:oligosaccharide flippase family protein [Caldilineaceae bacterium]